MINYLHKDWTSLNTTERNNITEITQNMTLDFRNGTNDRINKYIKIYYTDYITWKLTLNSNEQNSVVGDLEGKANVLKNADAAEALRAQQLAAA